MSFSRRDLFWYCAGVLSVLVAGFLLHALNGNQNSAPAPLHAEAMTTTPASVAPETPAAPEAPMGSSHAADAAGASGSAGSMDEALTRLESRLATRGGSDADWELLAQSYEFVGRNADARLARSHHLPASTTGAGVAGDGAPMTDAGPSLSGEVQLASALKQKVADGQTLFIIAKSVDSPGPPVAILRTVTGQWPLHFTLDDSNAMLPGRNLSSAQHVTIEARVSRGGGAIPASGDFQSPITAVDPHGAKAVHLVIDHVIG